MKKLLVCIYCFILSGSVSSAQSVTRTYIKHYRHLADSLSGRYNIPVSVILGIAVVESSSGTSQSCRRLKNHFGMKGKNNLRKTHKIFTRYKQYRDAKASFVDFCRMVRRRRYYSTLAGVNHYKPWLKAISMAGYSTRPAEWLKKVTGVIIVQKL